MTKTKIRREKVKTLIVRGIKESSIADELQVSVRTIERDVAAIRDELREELKTQKTEDIINNFILADDTVYKEGWKMYHGTDNEATKVKALNIIHMVVMDKIRTLQSLGILKKEIGELKIKEILAEWISFEPRKIDNTKPVATE